MKRKIVIPVPHYPYPQVDDIREMVRNLVVEIQGEHSDADRKHDFLVTGKPLENLLAIITYIWRIHDRINDRLNDEPKESLSVDEIKKIYKYTEQISDCFKSIGFEIKDRVGEPFNYGLPEKVVATKPQLGINHEMVIETLLPTVYFRDKTIQQGEIIIATPNNEPANN
jgi:hypothetical protein